MRRRLRPKRDGDDAAVEREPDFSGAEVALGAYENHGRAAGSVDFGEIDARHRHVAVADIFPHVGEHSDKVAEAGHGVNLREGGLERLLHGGDGYLFKSLHLDFLAFAAFAQHGDDTVDPDFGELFDEPFHAVHVLGRSHGSHDFLLPGEVRG